MTSSSCTSTGETLAGTPTIAAPVAAIDPTINRNASDPFAFGRPLDKQVKKALIMIVDDENLVTQALRTHLSGVGFSNFILENDATQVIKQIQATSPDLVLLDIRMQVDGMEILRTMRQIETMQRIPVIMLTSDTDIATRIRALSYGADDFLTKPVDVGELVARVRNTISGKIQRDQLSHQSAVLEDSVLIDSLTQIANRRAFDFELKRRMIQWTRQRTPLSMLLIDADSFQSVNDRHGKPVGDQLLQRMAKEIERSLRAMDLVSRIGGDRFAAILPDCDAKRARTATERVRAFIESLDLPVDDVVLRTTISVGVTSALDGDSVESIFRRAELALGEAKQQGRNCCYFHDGQRCAAVTADDGEEADTSRDVAIASDGDSIPSHQTTAKILVIDDEPSTSLMVRKLLMQENYSQVQTLNEPEKAFELIRSNPPDLVLCDIQMPVVTGLDILKLVGENGETKHVPIVVLTSSTEPETKIKCLNLGAADFLNKPVNASELIARVRNTLLAKAHLNHLAEQSVLLEHEVRLRTAELYASRREAIQCLACAAESRDDQTGHHVFRVGRYAAIIAGELGFAGEQVLSMEHAAQLHDVGKIGIPDNILKKPGRLTAEEYEIMKSHCLVGRRIIRCETAWSDPAGKVSSDMQSVLFEECNSPVMRMAAVVAESHHEKWDGTGYPLGLKGDAIPIEGRITAVADVFDAISSVRHYKNAMPLEQCFEFIQNASGTHFDPRVVEAFFKRKQDIVAVYLRYNDNRQ